MPGDGAVAAGGQCVPHGVAAAPTASLQECRQADPPALPGLGLGRAASWFCSLPQLKGHEEITEDLCGPCLKTSLSDVAS